MILSTFRVFFGNLCIFLGKMSIEFFGPDFDWVVSLFVGELQMLLKYFDTKRSDQINSLQIFSTNFEVVLTLLIVSFNAQKL